ncbi:MAG: hypothetical protein MZV65_53650 [Chromatiales bacterium]|nr:hypothetical protein [Chromatiales bacterium]
MLAGFRAPRQIVPLVVSVHTFTPQMAGFERPWHVGVLWDKDEPSARRLIDGLRGVEGARRGRQRAVQRQAPLRLHDRPPRRDARGCRTSASKFGRTSSSRRLAPSAGCGCSAG